MNPAPLHGIQVIELAQNLAGPFAGQILAQLGASVTKIERPGGDDARGWGPPFLDGTATTFIAVNRGKQSRTLDLRDPADRAALDGLVAGADVLVQNLRPGAVEAMGLGAAALLEKHPRLIHCSLGAFGASGPRQAEPGYEPILQAFSGLMMMNGEPGGPPTRTGVQILDLGTGVWAALGIVAALHRRTLTGRGGVVETSLLETALGWMGPHLAGVSVTGRAPPRHLSGNPNTVVFQAFETATAPIMIAAANDRLFVRLCQALDLPAAGQDPRFASNAGRVANKPALLALLEPCLAARPAESWLPLLAAAGIPSGPINTPVDILADEQVRAIGILEAQGQGMQCIGLPIVLDGERPRAIGPAP